jgi:hypothetical protein
MTEILSSWRNSLIFDLSELISQVLGLIELFDNTDLKCMVYLMNINLYD